MKNQKLTKNKLIQIIKEELQKENLEVVNEATSNPEIQRLASEIDKFDTTLRHNDVIISYGLAFNALEKLQNSNPKTKDIKRALDLLLKNVVSERRKFELIQNKLEQFLSKVSELEGKI